MTLRPQRQRLWLQAIVALTGALAAAGLLTASAGARTSAVPRNTSPPTISGTLRQGRTVTSTNGTWEENPTTFARQWQRCAVDGTGCADIAGATKTTYTLAAADVDHTVRVVVTASNADGPASAPSKASDVVSANTPPRNTSRPTISGTPQVGEELTADPGTWTGGVRTYAYQWQRCDESGANCTDVSGANGRSYGVRAVDVGDTLRVAVTATNLADSTSVTSDRTTVVRSVPTPPPSVNKRPTIVLLSARLVGVRVYARFRVCDDSQKNLTIIERDSKAGALSYTRRFSTLTPPLPCGTYARKWIPAARFRTSGRYVVTLWARDKSGLTSRPVRKVFVR